MEDSTEKRFSPKIVIYYTLAVILLTIYGGQV
jgi:preprotein translocase subunit Sec61beta